MTKILHIIAPILDYNLTNPSSQLLTSVDTFLSCDEYHTSLGDMSSADIIKVSANFPTIDFVADKFDQSSDTYKETVVLLNSLSHSKSITNFSIDAPILFADPMVNQRPNESLLWVFGCSHSHGVGLKPDEKKFGRIVSEVLDLPLMLVTKPGSSLNWSLRNLVAADIRSHDTVIWQVTSPHRLSKYNGKDTEEIVLARSNDRCLLDVFNDDQVFFNQINMLHFGVRYLRSLGCQFRIVSFVPQLSNFYDYLFEYSKYPEFCYTPNVHIDFGIDQTHYGPLSHRAIAQRIISSIQKKYINE